MFDTLNKEVAIVVDDKLNERTYEIEFDKTNLPEVEYFYKIETESLKETKK